MNGISHGLFSRRVVLPVEDKAEFNRFRRRAMYRFSARALDADARAICEEFVGLSWRLGRLKRMPLSADAATVQRFIRYEQRLMASIDRCVDHLLGLPKRTRVSQIARIAQMPHVPADVNRVASREGEKSQRFGHVEPKGPSERSTSDTRFHSRTAEPTL
jgi:hypothetical protein